MIKKKRLIIDGEVLVMPHFSGIGHYTLELLRAIDKELNTRHDIEVSVLIHYRHIEKAKQYGFKNIEIIPSPFSLRISNGLKIRNKQPFLDLLFGKGIYLFPNFSSWPLLRSKSIPIIYDLSYEKYAEFAEPRNQQFLSEQVRKAASRADQIITISENSKREIASFYHVSPKKIDVCYPAVDRDHFYRQSHEDIAKTLKKYDLKEKYILFVGNIEPRKNLKNLLLAYEKLPVGVRKQHSLLLVGAKGWQDEEIFETIERLQARGDTIQMPSHRVEDVDLPAIYSGASVFVYPSIYEGFGIPPLEAMACGVPVIASNNSSLPEACGSAALLVEADSVDQICSSINSVLGNTTLSERCIYKGYRQVEVFSWESSANKLLNLVGSL